MYQIYTLVGISHKKKRVAIKIFFALFSFLPVFLRYSLLFSEI